MMQSDQTLQIFVSEFFWTCMSSKNPVTKDKQVNYKALSDEEVQGILTEFNLVS